jgi:hypothetical protein
VYGTFINVDGPKAHVTILRACSVSCRSLASLMRPMCGSVPNIIVTTEARKAYNQFALVRRVLRHWLTDDPGERIQAG